MIKEIGLPERFTFPFYYEPHPLTKIAAAELQHYLETQTAIDHNFGLVADATGLVIGKMFGVLVIQDTDGRIGYLSGVSGKLGGTNDNPRFVPPVFDMLTEDSFFLKEQEVVSAINTKIEQLEASEKYTGLKSDIEVLTARAAEEIAAEKKLSKINKADRKQRRDEQKPLMDEQSYALFEAELMKESFLDQYLLKQLTDKWKSCLADMGAKQAEMDATIESLRNERRERSGALQEQLFEQYTFLNQAGETKSLQDIFSQTAFGRPPAGAGECATPKLLQYAFLHGYKPLAMAEFWWGASPKSDIRQHKQYYPACAGKCKPILAHMLDGMLLDDNPFLQMEEASHNLDVVYEDDSLIVINKPEGLRSVPGVNVAESVYTRLKASLNIEPYIVHRLDMGTSGLLVVAKTQSIHKHLQKQFLERKVHKRYTALLSRVISGDEGTINLPLCPDPFDRPRQIVDLEKGKTSITRWQAVEKTGTTTRVHFWPLTGRTHQLRMHAAHELGLNAPIVGDDLYGTAAERLYLHAAWLEFIHPATGERVSFEVGEEF